jgi:hypothetical protein
MTGLGTTHDLTIGYAAALKALRHLDTTTTNSAIEHAALHLELARADTAIAASSTSPGAIELGELLTAIRRHDNRHSPIPTVELARAFQKARLATINAALPCR